MAKNTVKVSEFENACCICCVGEAEFRGEDGDKVDFKLIKIGAYTVCRKHWKSEFNGVKEIEVDSPLYRDVYLKWLEVYKA